VTTRQRLEAIDQFRGFAILLMIAANYLSNIGWIPAWLKHAPDVGRLPVLTDWGRNPLLLYLLHCAFLAVFALPPMPGWYMAAALWLVLLQLLALLATLSSIGLYLNRRERYFVL